MINKNTTFTGRFDFNSIIICTRNRGESLALAVASLEGTPPWLRWELLVIDNASEDDTQDRLRDMEEEYSAPLFMK